MTVPEHHFDAARGRDADAYGRDAYANEEVTS
jgi:hypothetical protein